METPIKENITATQVRKICSKGWQTSIAGQPDPYCNLCVKVGMRIWEFLEVLVQYFLQAAVIAMLKKNKRHHEENGDDNMMSFNTNTNRLLSKQVLHLLSNLVYH